MEFLRCSGVYMPAWNDVSAGKICVCQAYFFPLCLAPARPVCVFLPSLHCCSAASYALLQLMLYADRVSGPHWLLWVGEMRYAAPRRDVLFLGPPSPGSRRLVINIHSLPPGVCVLCLRFFSAHLLAVCLSDSLSAVAACPPPLRLIRGLNRNNC